ncbi:SGNH hydrolase [Actinoplanes ianthinogenes]|uniref:SGNH hydrolase n=1 Tax=Actinoplanes ianthinogenes TaxID=122358 RepID=A0ABM7MA05_9ACTN|nr:SGNH/GDSL hydrolase family protein [Actinoplanes ianthinogenes]BCJ48433.1 SGNH hydrolase [Actinoplanes ianthinogenes]GGR46417.1 SGNH hydrolase [Actinoplanes ianthinogenes]
MTGTNGPDRWVRTWGAAPQAPGAAVAALEPFADATLRQVVRVSGGGRAVRVRFTNEYGTAPLTIGAARAGDRALTFAGRQSATVPVGAPLLSDPVDLAVPALARLTISAYLPGRVESCTGHGRPVEASWLIPGDAVAARDLPGNAVPLPVRALISAVDVIPDGPAEAVVVLGDSIADGFGSAPDADRSWPDRLAERLTGVCVVNQGISGNRLLNEGHGDAAPARFDRDVLATPGLGYLVVAIGLGDIGISYAPRDADGPPAEFLTMFPGAPVTADDLIAGYRQLIARARDRGVMVYGATLTPYGRDEMFSMDGERVRQAVNDWIRTGGAFDAVLDFDAVWRDRERPSRVIDGFHAGDVHGSDAGYRALADSIDLALFAKGI